MKHKKLLTIFFGLGFLALASSAHAADLIFSPAAGNYALHGTFSVAIEVSSAVAVNAYSGDIRYPEDKLSVSSISKDNSIVNFWTSDPSVASPGDIHFEGITLSPGFTGNNGKIITITFKAIAAGGAPVAFSSSSVLANDGFGTNVEATTETAFYVVGAAAATAPAPSPTPAPVPTPIPVPTPVPAPASPLTQVPSPVLSTYQSKLRDGDFMVIQGTAVPDSVVSFSLTRELPEERFFGTPVYMTAGSETLSGTVRSDSTGAFTFAYPDRLPYGLYQISAYTTIADGLKSAPSTIAIPVIENAWTRFLGLFTSFAALAMLLFLIACVCLILFIRTLRKYRSLQKETEEMMLLRTDRLAGR